MKNSFVLILTILIFCASSAAQKSDQIIVKAGTRVQDYFPISERYRYPAFIDGKVIFNNGKYSDAKLNYNFLSGEMEYVHSRDTLAISNPEEINYITIHETDTFYYRKGYLELIYGNKIKVAMKQTIALIDVQKKDTYGVSGSGSATESVKLLQTTGNSYKLTVNEDRVFQKISEYLIAVSSDKFFLFNKQKIMQLFPKQKEAIRDYLKSNKVDFTSRNDLIRLAGFLQNL